MLLFNAITAHALRQSLTDGEHRWEWMPVYLYRVAGLLSVRSGVLGLGTASATVAGEGCESIVGFRALKSLATEVPPPSDGEVGGDVGGVRPCPRGERACIVT